MILYYSNVSICTSVAEMIVCPVWKNMLADLPDIVPEEDRKVYDAIDDYENLNVGDVRISRYSVVKGHSVVLLMLPDWIDGLHNEYEQIAYCYRSVLAVALEKNTLSISIPLLWPGNHKGDSNKRIRDAIEIFSEPEYIDIQIHLNISHSVAEEFLKTEYPEFYQRFIYKWQNEESENTDKRKERPVGVVPLQYIKTQREELQDLYNDAEVIKDCISTLPNKLKNRTNIKETIVSNHKRSDKKRKALSFVSTENNEQETQSDFAGKPEFFDYDLSTPIEFETQGPESEIVDQNHDIAVIMSDLDSKLLKEKQEESFREMLFHLIDRSGLTDAEVYKRANLDRRHFSKIRNNKDYQPQKSTVVALAIALCLNIDETTDLLRRAGYAFSNNDMFDCIIQYFIKRGLYDIHIINIALFEHNEKLLGIV